MWASLFQTSRALHASCGSCLMRFWAESQISRRRAPIWNDSLATAEECARLFKTSFTLKEVDKKYQPFFQMDFLDFLIFFFKGSRLWMSHFSDNESCFQHLNELQTVPSFVDSTFQNLHAHKKGSLCDITKTTGTSPSVSRSAYLSIRCGRLEVYNKASILIPRMNPHSVLQLWDRLQSHRLFLVSWPPLRKALLLMLVLTLCTKD